MKMASMARAALVVAVILAARWGGAATLSDERVKAKVEALLGQMTLEEKVGQLTQIGGGSFPPGNKP